MTVRIDPGLGAPTLPGRVDALPEPAGGAVLAGTAGAAPFRLEGGEVVLAGEERGGVDAVRVGGRRVAADLVVDAGLAVNLLVAPSALRRERVGSRGSVLETLLAAPTLPLAALQWRTPDGAPSLPGLTVSVTLLPDSPDVRYRVVEGGVRVAGEGVGRVVDLALLPPPRSWEVVEGPGGGVVVRAEAGPADTLTLLLAAGTEERAGRALQAGAHLTAHARLAADGDDEEGLHTATGVDEVDQGVAWATRRLRAALARAPAAAPGDADPAHHFWCGVGALAAGDVVGAEAALALLAAHAGACDPGLGSPLPIEVLGLLLAARLALTGGRVEPLLTRLDAFGPDRAERRGQEPEAERALRALAFRRAADALRYAAPPDLVAALRARGEGPEAGASSRLAGAETDSGPRARRLPMLGQGGGAGSADLLEALLFPGKALGDGPGPAPTLALLAPWSDLARGRVAEPWAAWRRLLSEGLSPAGPPPGRGLWDAASPTPAPSAPGAALVLATLVHGVLGMDPDAPSGRVGVAPRLPGHVRAFEVGGLRVGEAAFTLGYRRAGACHRFTLEPTRGREPPVVVFRPTLPCPRVGAVRIDGRRADLDVAPGREGSVLRAQIPLDVSWGGGV